MKVIVKVYDMCKYNPASEKIAEAQYDDVTKIEVVEISDDEILNRGFEDVDEYGEYLVLTYEDGETSTFRNSHVDLFRA